MSPPTDSQGPTDDMTMTLLGVACRPRIPPAFEHPDKHVSSARAKNTATHTLLRKHYLRHRTGAASGEITVLDPKP
jgi:hypothetical protein